MIGTVAPILLLWFYQWQAFGHPFYPGQHWMPPVEWIERGYQGVGGPQAELLLALAFDHRFGLFVSAPILFFALAAPFVHGGNGEHSSEFELAALLGIAGALWVFFSGVNYTRLQFNTGIRYLSPTFPFLFVPAAVVLIRLPRPVIYFVAVGAVAQAWCMAMYRDVERGSFGVLEPVCRRSWGLPVARLDNSCASWRSIRRYFPDGVSPLPLFVLTAAIVYGIWRWPQREAAG